MAPTLFPLTETTALLPTNPTQLRFHYALRHGTMKLGLYAPTGPDTQTPHKQDELYIVTSGSGDFIKNGARHPFTTGDALFVEAGADHNFENFTPNFATWVIFYGPEGGEKPPTP